jgi:transketolase
MRREFFQKLLEEMNKNDQIYAISIDLGYGGFDAIQHYHPKRFINTGAAEQGAFDMACGLALSGKIPFIYTITPFIYRGFETLRTYINHDKLNVKIVGSGRDKDYAHDGFSHYAGDDKKIMKTMSNIKMCHPDSVDEMKDIVDKMIIDDNPYYLNLKR